MQRRACASASGKGRINGRVRRNVRAIERRAKILEPPRDLEDGLGRVIGPTSAAIAEPATELDDRARRGPERDEARPQAPLKLLVGPRGAAPEVLAIRVTDNDNRVRLDAEPGPPRSPALYVWNVSRRDPSLMGSARVQNRRLKHERYADFQPTGRQQGRLVLPSGCR